jgi:translation initiation factor 2 subunit 2
MNYEELLEKAYKELPEKQKETKRLEVPKPDSMIQGKKTVIKNFGQIIKVIRRPEKHFLKFLTRETGSSGTVSDGRLTLNGKFGFIQISKWFDAYIKQFVACRECEKLDTKITEQGRTKILKCEACGAAFPVQKL